ncbi:hypothetical protein SPONL_1150 [uncultured Candidatus Thioglobus sp.]|nr:hypothetical protein SPONL_1150 [uncultured Candidatus Thioglobus sp.]
MVECTSLGGPNNTYQWQANGTNLVGETSPNLTLSGIVASTGGIYTCAVFNQAGSHSASTFVFVYPYIIIEPPEIIIVSVNSSVLLVCDAESFPNPEYLWLRAEGRSFREVIATNGRNLNISSINYGDEGEYYCNASARGRNAQSQVAVIAGKLITHYLTRWYSLSKWFFFFYKLLHVLCYWRTTSIKPILKERQLW